MNSGCPVATLAGVVDSTTGVATSSPASADNASSNVPRICFGVTIVEYQLLLLFLILLFRFILRNPL